MKTVRERTIKFRIKLVLDKYFGDCYYYMPVPGGYGTSTLDYLGFVMGKGFAIEAKSSIGKLTARQEGIADRISNSGAKVFVINDEPSLDKLDKWLSKACAKKGKHE
jgi:hypothetical protein